MTHIMLDLETWGTAPGCDLRSIGACVFSTPARHGGYLVHDGSLGTIKPFYVATDNPSNDPESNPPQPNLTGRAWTWDGVDAFRKYPLTRNPQTVQWWSDQSDEAQGAFANPVDLKDSLQAFTDWLSMFADVKIWSHGSHFDVPILAAAYDAVNLTVPWHYRAPRDTRTAFDMAGVVDHSAWLTQHALEGTTHHHALDDAVNQARAVCAAFAKLKGEQNG